MGEVTREVTLQWRLHQIPPMDRREEKRLSHLPRKKAKDPRPLQLQIRRDPKKARVRKPQLLLPKAALTAKEPTQRALTERAPAMPRALTARAPMENQAAKMLRDQRMARDPKMEREWRTNNRAGALLMDLVLSD